MNFTSFINYGPTHTSEFPNPDNVLQELKYGQVATIKDIVTDCTYILMNGLNYWTQLDDVEAIEGKWIMALDDFENGWGELQYPHCFKCNRGVYRHDAGSFCPFCGTPMRNPMR